MKRLSRREFLAISASAAGVGLLAACTPKPATTVAPTAKPAATAVQKVAGLAKLEGKTGVLWGLKYDPHVAGYNLLANLFKSKTGATLTIEPQDWPLETKVIAALAGGTMPDVACIMGKMCVPLYIQGILAPLDDVAYAAMGVKPNEIFFDDAVTAYTWEGKIYGTPIEAGGLGNVVNVPVDELKRLGIDKKYPPTDGRIWWKDYNEMFECAKALQIEKDGKVTRWGLSSKGWDSSAVIGMARSLLAESGKDWWDNTNKKFLADSPEMIQAIKWFAEDPVNMGIETELDQSHVDAALAGKCALARGNGTPSIQISKDLGYNFECSGVPMCVPNKPPLSCSEAGWGFVTPKTAKNKDVAIEFMKMMVTEEGQIEANKMYDGVTGVAYRKNAGKFDWWKEKDPNASTIRFAKFYQEKLCPLARYYGEGLGYYGEVDTIFGEEMSNVRMKKTTAAQVAKTIQERLVKQYEQFVVDSKK